jgi:hypothetical protein
VLKANAQSFYKATKTLREMADVAASGPPDLTLTSKDARPIVAKLKELQSSLLILGTRAAAMHVDNALKALAASAFSYGDLTSALDNIDSTLENELSLVTLLVVGSDKHKYFEPSGPMFGVDVHTKFPSMTFEIDEAGKCLAFHRPTSTVFHFMRAMEIGIRSVSRCLGIPDSVSGSGRNWGTILRLMKAEIDRRNTAVPAQWPVAGDRDLFEDAYISLDAVRNTWRNATMHVENTYTDDEAEHILVACRAFLTKIAGRHDEQGLPAA